MAWTKAYSDLDGHPKVIRLAALLGCDTDAALGKLQRFWWWSQKYAEDGILTRFLPGEINTAITGKPDSRFIESLVACNLVDSVPYLRIHDWWEYIGPWLISKYKKSPSKWKRIKRLYSERRFVKKAVTVTSTVTAPVTVPGMVTAQIRQDLDSELQEPLTPQSGDLASPEPPQKKGGGNTRLRAPTLRELHLNPRELKINPRAQKTNPRHLDKKAAEERSRLTLIRLHEVPDDSELPTMDDILQAKLAAGLIRKTPAPSILSSVDTLIQSERKVFAYA